jgi:hypothetical protein
MMKTIFGCVGAAARAAGVRTAERARRRDRAEKASRRERENEGGGRLIF